MEKIKLIVVDEQKAVRDRLRTMLLGNPEIEIIAEASTLAILLNLLQQHCPEMIVVGGELRTDVSGMGAVEVLSPLSSEYKIIMLHNHVDESGFIASIKAGIRGFLGKDCSHEELIKAVMWLHQGEMYFGAHISKALIQHYLRQPRNLLSEADKPLSNREIEIVKCLGEGLTTKKIGEVLCISPRTVESHKNKILGKLGLQNTIQLVKYAIKHHIIDL